MLVNRPFPTAKESWASVYRASKTSQIRTEMDKLKVAYLKTQAAEHDNDTQQTRPHLLEALVKAKYNKLMEESPKKRQKKQEKTNIDM